MTTATADRSLEGVLAGGVARKKGGAPTLTIRACAYIQELQKRKSAWSGQRFLAEKPENFTINHEHPLLSKKICKVYNNYVNQK